MKALRNRLLFGTEEEVPQTTLLRAGPLDVVLRGARIWQVRLGEAEIWHGVAFLFRDPDWGTPEPVVKHSESAVIEESFLFRCTGHFPTSPAVDFRIDVEGSPEGWIRFSGEAVPREDILASRCGICVMHPMAAAGARIEVQHTDGRESQSTFPTLIPPWPPFMLIRAIRHEYEAGHWGRCDFAGDLFEFEDQRNNSDASFKTYSRSNLMPRPYWLRAGVPVRQSATLRLETPRARPALRREPTVLVRVGETISDLPSVGIEITPTDAKASEAVCEALRAMRPGHLHLSLDSITIKDVDWKRIKDLLATAEANLRLDLTLSDIAHADDVLEGLRANLLNARISCAAMAIFPSEQRCVDTARRVFPAAQIGGGTPYFFVQLNRLESLGMVDFLTFTTSPIVHGADDASVMSSLQSLPSIVATLRATHPDAPIRIGPSSIATRKSPLGGQPETDGTRRVPLARHDPRCRGLFGAAWSLGYVAQLALAGADAVTLMSLSGPSGVLGCTDDGRITKYPAYFILERLQIPARVYDVTVSEPRSLEALALSRGVDKELLLANLTGNQIEVQVEGWPASDQMWMIDTNISEGTPSLPASWEARPRAEGTRLRLEPYAVASLRGELR